MLRGWRGLAVGAKDTFAGPRLKGLDEPDRLGKGEFVKIVSFSYSTRGWNGCSQSRSCRRLLLTIQSDALLAKQQPQAKLEGGIELCRGKPGAGRGQGGMARGDDLLRHRMQ